MMAARNELEYDGNSRPVTLAPSRRLRRAARVLLAGYADHDLELAVVALRDAAAESGEV